MRTLVPKLGDIVDDAGKVGLILADNLFEPKALLATRELLSSPVHVYREVAADKFARYLVFLGPSHTHEGWQTLGRMFQDGEPAMRDTILTIINKYSKKVSTSRQFALPHDVLETVRAISEGWTTIQDPKRDQSRADAILLRLGYRPNLDTDDLDVSLTKAMNENPKLARVAALRRFREHSSDLLNLEKRDKDPYQIALGAIMMMGDALHADPSMMKERIQVQLGNLNDVEYRLPNGQTLYAPLSLAAFNLFGQEVDDKIKAKGRLQNTIQEIRSDVFNEVSQKHTFTLVSGNSVSLTHAAFAFIALNCIATMPPKGAGRDTRTLAGRMQGVAHSINMTYPSTQIESVIASLAENGIIKIAPDFSVSFGENIL